MEIKAQLNYLRIAPRKVRLVTALLKGMSTKRAELELRHLPKRSSTNLMKLLKSAVANAKHNFQVEESELYIKDIGVNQGPVLKRSMPRAFGRAAPIMKRSSHVCITLETKVSRDRVRPQNKGAPVVRDVTEEDVKEEFFAVSKEENKTAAPKVLKSGTKRADFIKRMFRRKAI